MSYYYNGPNVQIQPQSSHSFFFMGFSPVYNVLVQPSDLPDEIALSSMYIFLKIDGYFDKDVTVYAF